jgi:uncharacterized protein
MDDPQFDKQILTDIVTYTMPFGKYKGCLLCDIPIHYLEWMVNKGAMPKGKLGMQLHTVYEMKSNGLGDIIEGLKKLK